MRTPSVEPRKPLLVPSGPMRKIEKPSPTESPLLFEIDPEPATEVLTALGGVPLVVQAFRSLGVPGSVKQHVKI